MGPVGDFLDVMVFYGDVILNQLDLCKDHVEEVISLERKQKPKFKLNRDSPD